jgi:hypothetical protein
MKVVFERKDILKRSSGKSSHGMVLGDFTTHWSVRRAERVEFDDGERIFVLKDRHGDFRVIEKVKKAAPSEPGILPKPGFLPSFRHIKWKKGGDCWYKDCKLHRDDDEPAVIEPDGTRKWYRDGVLHREGGQPAIVCASGEQLWYKDGKIHRDGDQPALVRVGTQAWYKDGKAHREGGLPAIIHENGSKFWYKDGKKYTPQDVVQKDVVQKDVAATAALPQCAHEYVNVSFSHIVMACKHCGRAQ